MLGSPLFREVMPKIFLVTFLGVGPAGPVSEIWVKFPGRVLSAWYQSFRFPILSDCSPHELIWLLVSYSDGPTATDPTTWDIGR